MNLRGLSLDKAHVDVLGFDELVLIERMMFDGRTDTVDISWIHVQMRGRAYSQRFPVVLSMDIPRPAYTEI
jgi:hypothetical protein